MIQPIKWQEASDKEKVGALIQHVLQFPIQENTTIFTDQEHATWYEYEYGIRYWNIFRRINDTSFVSEAFDPLHDLDSVRLLIRRMAQSHPLLNLNLIMYTYNRCYACFSLTPEHEEWSEGNGEHCIEDAICIAALRSVGIEVIA